MLLKMNVMRWYFYIISSFWLYIFSNRIQSFRSVSVWILNIYYDVIMNSLRRFSNSSSGKRNLQKRGTPLIKIDAYIKTCTLKKILHVLKAINHTVSKLRIFIENELQETGVLLLLCIPCICIHWILTLAISFAWISLLFHFFISEIRISSISTTAYLFSYNSKYNYSIRRFCPNYFHYAHG